MTLQGRATTSFKEGEYIRIVVLFILIVFHIGFVFSVSSSAGRSRGRTMSLYCRPEDTSNSCRRDELNILGTTSTIKVLQKSLVIFRRCFLFFAKSPAPPSRKPLQVKSLEKKLEDAIAENADLDKKLRLEENKAMEFLFEKTQFETKIQKLTGQNSDLETILKTGGGSSEENEKRVKADQLKQSRREKNLEAVVEGLEGVINRLRKENVKLAQDCERFSKEARRAQFSQAELNQLKQELNATSCEKSDALLNFTTKIKALNEQLENANTVNAKLEEDNLELAKTATSARDRVGGLKKEVQELRQARAEDKEALDVAQELMTDVTKTEERYRSIVAENRELRSEKSRTRERVERLESYRGNAMPLVEQSGEILQALDEKYPGLQIPRGLLEGLVGLART